MKSGFCQQRGIVLKVINLTHEPSSLFHGFDRCGVGQLLNPEDMTKPSLEVRGGGRLGPGTFQGISKIDCNTEEECSR